jgi:hypothetical protein
MQVTARLPAEIRLDLPCQQVHPLAVIADAFLDVVSS